ncbi:unnamed protein product [Calicophoron daubneyi]|uniref:Uncharacterized protein n=1 Tax=Calicophoron daubneyi TaxID=300641 RepID=A0AAV2TEI5_CALDB
MDTRCYVVAILPDCENEVVLLSSTWITEERSQDDLPITQMPSVRPDKLYQAAKNHIPCKPGDKKYTFHEYGRTILFSSARQMELDLSENSTISSEGTVYMGLPPKRKIRRKVFSEEETLRLPKQTANRPAMVEYNLDGLESVASDIHECNAYLCQTSHPLIFSTSAVVQTYSSLRMLSPPPIHSGPILTPKSSIRRLQSPPGNNSESIRASHSPTNLCLSGESVFSMKVGFLSLICSCTGVYGKCTRH